MVESRGAQTVYMTAPCASPMHPLFKMAVSVLSTDAPVAVQVAACEALVAGADAGLQLGERSAQVVWSWLAQHPDLVSWRSRQGLVEALGDDVRARSIVALLDWSAGQEIRDMAVEVLSRPRHAAHLDEQTLLGIVEVAHTCEDVESLVRLVRAVDDARGIARKELVAIRDRLACTNRPESREASVNISRYATEVDASFLTRMLEDSNSDVRVAVAAAIDDRSEDLPAMAGVVDEKLLSEESPSVRAALLRCRAALTETLEGIERRGRRRR